jgi:uncharacterized protein (DUF58 family)
LPATEARAGAVALALALGLVLALALAVGLAVRLGLALGLALALATVIGFGCPRSARNTTAAPTSASRITIPADSAITRPVELFAGAGDA